MNDHWDCPSCGRPTPPEIDVECNCGMKSSHHLSVSAMCRILHSVTDREAALIVEKDKLIRQLAAERALADRLADALATALGSWVTSPYAEKAIEAWKEARSE